VGGFVLGEFILHYLIFSLVVTLQADYIQPRFSHLGVFRESVTAHSSICCPIA